MCPKTAQCLEKVRKLHSHPVTWMAGTGTPRLTPLSPGVTDSESCQKCELPTAKSHVFGNTNWQTTWMFKAFHLKLQKNIIDHWGNFYSLNYHIIKTWFQEKTRAFRLSFKNQASDISPSRLRVRLQKLRLLQRFQEILANPPPEMVLSEDVGKMDHDF